MDTSAIPATNEVDTSGSNKESAMFEGYEGIMETVLFAGERYDADIFLKIMIVKELQEMNRNLGNIDYDLRRIQ